MIESIIAGVAAILVCLINNVVQIKSIKEEHNKTMGLIEYRLEELTKKVEKHNNLVERMTIVEQNLKTALKSIDELKDDVDDIESK